MRTGLDLGHSDGGIYHLTQEGASERAYGGFGRTVHATAHVRLPSRDRSEIDDMARVAGFEVCCDLSAAANVNTADDHE